MAFTPSAPLYPKAGTDTSVWLDETGPADRFAKAGTGGTVWFDTTGPAEFAWVASADGATAFYESAAAWTVTATPGADSITLSWDAWAGADRYDVEIDGVVTVLDVAALTYTHTGLGASESHDYRVRPITL